MDECIAVILGGGRGTRLFPLTQHRSKPAVPIAGKYRLIDIPISNCLNVGLRRIFVLTQYNSQSLNKHISRTYKFDGFSEGFVTILAAEQTEDSPEWFQGTADAVRQSLRHIRAYRARDVLVLSAGNSTRNVEPLPTSLSTEMVPACDVTMEWQMASPRPRRADRGSPRGGCGRMRGSRGASPRRPCSR